METVELKEIIDTWNLLEDYNVTSYRCNERRQSIVISKSDFDKIYEGVKNKRYILNLVR